MLPSAAARARRRKKTAPIRRIVLVVAGAGGGILLGTLASPAIHGVGRHLGAAKTADATLPLPSFPIQHEHA